jgi:uncharacterized membrane protein YeaQ/YmgE (transglycosylase-associated protein family)
MGFLAWIMMGLIAGAIAKAITKSGGGWISSLIVGLIGGVVGGWIGSFFGERISGFLSIWSWVLTIAGAVVVLWIYNLITRNKA